MTIRFGVPISVDNAHRIALLSAPRRCRLDELAGNRNRQTVPSYRCHEFHAGNDGEPSAMAQLVTPERHYPLLDWCGSDVRVHQDRLLRRRQPCRLASTRSCAGTDAAVQSHVVSTRLTRAGTE